MFSLVKITNSRLFDMIRRPVGSAAALELSKMNGLEDYGAVRLGMIVKKHGILDLPDKTAYVISMHHKDDGYERAKSALVVYDLPNIPGVANNDYLAAIGVTGRIKEHVNKVNDKLDKVSIRSIRSGNKDIISNYIWNAYEWRRAYREQFKEFSNIISKYGDFNIALGFGPETRYGLTYFIQPKDVLDAMDATIEFVAVLPVERSLNGVYIDTRIPEDVRSNIIEAVLASKNHELFTGSESRSYRVRYIPENIPSKLLEQQ